MNQKLMGLFAGLMFCGLGSLTFTGVAQATEMVVNGDFETDTNLFVTWPGYVASGSNPAEIPGWTGSGLRGINPVVPDGPGDSPFRDNGDNTTSVAFLQGTASIQQDIPGFTIGDDYIVKMDFNARDCCGGAMPVAEILLDGVVAFDSSSVFPPTGSIAPVGGVEPWYSLMFGFTALESNITLAINSAPATFGGDATLLLDNISITSGSIPEPTALLLMGSGLAGIGFARRRKLN